jgi:hypothetical protein
MDETRRVLLALNAEAQVVIPANHAMGVESVQTAKGMMMYAQTAMDVVVLIALLAEAVV